MPPTLVQPNVPILGQIMTVGPTTLLPMVTCHCPTGGTLVLMAQVLPVGLYTAPGSCPSCRRVFILRGLRLTDTGGIEYQIETIPPPLGDS